MRPTVCRGQPSWKIAANRVEACITQQGGHLAPVRFQLPQGDIEPYAIAPWAEEAQDSAMIPLLQSLRGDFFCMPFGEVCLSGKTKSPIEGNASLPMERPQTACGASSRSKAIPPEQRCICHSLC